MCNLVIKLEVSYNIGLPAPWSRGPAQQPQPPQALQRQEAPAPLLPGTASQEDRQQTAAHQPASSHVGSWEQSHQHLRSLDVNPQQARRMDGVGPRQLSQTQRGTPQQAGAVDRWQSNAATSEDHDYYFPAQRGLSPQLSQERVEAYVQMQRSRIATPQLSQGFAAMTWPPARTSLTSASQQQGSDRTQAHSAADEAQDISPIAQQASGHQNGSNFLPDMAPHQHGEIRSNLLHQQSDGLPQQEPARRRSLRRALSGNWAPGNVLRRIVGNARRNHNDPLARSSSSNAGRVASRTDLADESAMPNAK